MFAYFVDIHDYCPSLSIELNFTLYNKPRVSN